MVDKITSVRRARFGTRIGRLADEDMVRLSRTLVVFLGIGFPGVTQQPAAG
jgi:mRNA interferase MazF